MARKIHPIAGTLALVMIAAFWISTAASELSGSRAAIVAVKTAIPWGLLLMVPALALAGGTGFVLRKARRGARLVEAKARRMPFIAANGIVVLVPSALFLAAKAAAGEFDGAFYAVQVLELVAGATNLVLLGRNLLDGLKISGRMRVPRGPTARPG